MAKKITQALYEADQTYNVKQVYSGSFVGDLTGNADTATRLKDNFTVSMTGDASGMFTTNGNSTSFAVTVARAAEADKARHADTAGSVQTAATAQLASRAETASTADRAGFATSADVSRHADTATNATNAVSANQADYAKFADETISSKTAEYAATAQEAVHAQTADRLTDPNQPVPHAAYADKAGVAEIAQYDCLGQSIIDYYALKTDLLPYKDMLTIECAKDLFIPREEQIYQVLVKGKAKGRGVIDGNTITIYIDCFAGYGNGGWNIYGDLEFVDRLPEPDDADTTKVYVDGKKHMHLWSKANRGWFQLHADLSPEDQKKLEDLLQQAQDNLDSAVLIRGDQTIQGRKDFKDLITAEIPDMTDDPRTVTVVHNLLDMRDALLMDMGRIEDSLEDKIDAIKDAVKAQQVGLIQFAYKDYTEKGNQPEMSVGVVYLGYRDEDKNYIAIDPSTNRPVDPEAKVRYIRHFVKDTAGNVTWYDVDTHPDMTGYAKLTGAEFTGPVKVPSMPLVTNDTRVFNSQDIQHLLQDVHTATDHKLESYMPKAGGEFTGDVQVPFAADALTAPDKAVLNKKNVLDLISENAASLIFLEGMPSDPSELKANKLYAVPVTVSDNEVSDVLLFPHQIEEGEIQDRQIAFYVSEQEGLKV